MHGHADYNYYVKDVANLPLLCSLKYHSGMCHSCEALIGTGARLVSGLCDTVCSATGVASCDQALLLTPPTHNYLTTKLYI